MPLTLILDPAQLEAPGRGKAIVVTPENQHELDVRVTRPGGALCLQIDHCEIHSIAQANPTPTTPRKSKAFKGSRVPVPKEVRDILTSIPYPILCSVAHTIKAKPSHLAHLGETVTVQLLNAIETELNARGFGIYRGDELPLVSHQV